MRTTAEIVDDLREYNDDEYRVAREAADRLDELEAEVAKLHEDIGPGVTSAELRSRYDVLRPNYELMQAAVEECEADLAAIDALRPDCPRCGRTQRLTNDFKCICHDDLGHHSIPCPDCSDGKVSVAQLAATWWAVWDDDHEAWHYAANWTRRALRSVRP